MKQNYPIIVEQFPAFIKTEFRNFNAFLNHYFQWLEENYLDEINLFRKRLETNSEEEGYIQKILGELGFNFEKNYGISRSLLIHFLKEFYSIRGTEESFRFLFRLLFNQDCSIRYPRERLFSCSNAIYSNEFYIFVKITNETRHSEKYTLVRESINSFGNVRVKGKLSGTEYFIENISELLIGNEFYIKIQINANELEFQILEAVECHNDVASFFGNIVNISNFEIKNSGILYRSGDKITIESNSRGNVEVESTSRGDIKSIKIINPGANYLVGDLVKSEKTESGSDFTGMVSEITDAGGIKAIRILSPGYQFERLPEIFVISDTGTDAIIEGETDNIGNILKIKVSEPYFDFNSTSPIQIDSEFGRGAELNFFPVAIFSSQKSHKNSIGFLEHNGIITDSFYFQQFSYELVSNTSAIHFDDLLNSFIHPSGFVRLNILSVEDSGDLPLLKNPLEIETDKYSSLNAKFFGRSGENVKFELQMNVNLLGLKSINNGELFAFAFENTFESSNSTSGERSSLSLTRS